MRVIALFLAAVISTPATASTKQSPASVRDSIVTAALAQKSVHWTLSVANLWSTARTADVSAGSAAEQVTFDRTGRLGKAKILRVGGTEYVKGDTAGLEDDLDLTPAQARRYAGLWISIPRGDASYTTYGLTLNSVVHEAIPKGQLTVSRTRSHGRRLLVVKGRTKDKRGGYRSTESADAGTRLPVSYLGREMDVGVFERFSKWNESLHVHTPARSTPIAVVRSS